MKKSELYPQLPDISFTEYDVETVSTQVISSYEAVTGRTLALSDPVRLFLYAVADIIAHQRMLIDIAAKNNLIAYAEGDYLDHIGALLGVSRLEDEDDDSLRERIRISPDRFSTAGPAKAYKFYAKSVDPDIIDVKVLTPPYVDPGHVDIYPLMTGGVIPDTHILDAVFMACSDDSVRPDTDFVTVKAPSQVSFSLSLSYWIDINEATLSAKIQDAVNEAINSWVMWQKSALGRDINPSELTRRIINAGALRCEITSPVYTKIRPSQVAICDGISVTFAGLVDS